MPPSVALEEEEAQEEPLLEEEEEDRVHLEPPAVEELRQTLQYLLHKYQLRRQQMSAPWEQPRVPSQENVTKQKIGLTNCADIIVLTLESQGLNHQFVKWPCVTNKFWYVSMDWDRYYTHWESFKMGSAILGPLWFVNCTPLKD